MGFTQLGFAEHNYRISYLGLRPSVPKAVEADQAQEAFGQNVAVRAMAGPFGHHQALLSNYKQKIRPSYLLTNYGAANSPDAAVVQPELSRHGRSTDLVI